MKRPAGDTDHLYGEEGSGCGKNRGNRTAADIFPNAASVQKGAQNAGPGSHPQKIAARVPRVFWVNALGEWLLGQKAPVPQRQRMLLTLRTAVRVGCSF